MTTSPFAAIRALRGRALLIKSLSLGSVDEPLEDNRTILDAAHAAGRHREVVADKIELGDFGLLEK
jgi:hypothetical protein